MKVDPHWLVHTEEIQEKVVPMILAVVEGSVPEWKSTLHFPVVELEYALWQLGFERVEVETNGWEWDWWRTYEKDGKGYTLSGSGYLGHLKFYPAEEER